jgi:hypothetical protein
MKEELKQMILEKIMEENKDKTISDETIEMLYHYILIQLKTILQQGQIMSDGRKITKEDIEFVFI